MLTCFDRIVLLPLLLLFGREAKKRKKTQNHSTATEVASQFRQRINLSARGSNYFDRIILLPVFISLLFFIVVIGSEVRKQKSSQR
jgi:hypothetical protein